MAVGTLRQYNGSTWDEILPKTTWQAVYEGSADTKIPVSYLPSAVIGGMHFTGTSTTENLAELAGRLDPGYPFEGQYFIAANNSGVLDVGTHTWHPQAVDDGTDGGPSINLEKGDWIICLEYTNADTTVWGVINNTYGYGTTVDYGVVKVSSKTTISSLVSASQVISETGFKTLIDDSTYTAGHNHGNASTSVAGFTQLSNATVLTGLSGNHVITEGVLNTIVGATDGLASKDWVENTFSPDGDAVFITRSSWTPNGSLSYAPGTTSLDDFADDVSQLTYVQISETAPTTPIKGMLWLDT